LSNLLSHELWRLPSRRDRQSEKRSIPQFYGVIGVHKWTDMRNLFRTYPPNGNKP
jgi:hypothetical protein